MQYFGFDRPSFGIKTFGFGVSNSKISADFTTGTYKADGAAKTFADLFTFSRAGKAWLVKDTGLQEYATDVPRFDNGLLIEQSATSYSKAISSITSDSLTTRTGNVFTTKSVDTHSFSQFNPLGLYPAGVPAIPTWSGKVVTKAIKFDGFGSNSEVSITSRQIYRDAQARVTSTGTLIGTGVKYAKNYLYSIVSFDGSMSGAELAYPASFAVLWGGSGSAYTIPKVGASLTITDIQYIVGNHDSTLIGDKSASTVTRPADFLLNKITGTTVTGDWDSTLTLSIVNGQLVHSGYGRIRSLEIN